MTTIKEIADRALNIPVTGILTMTASEIEFVESQRASMTRREPFKIKGPMRLFGRVVMEVAE